jgi:hypothetical protein
MRDPELVARAGYAAARLEQAWERWRALHGLGGSADPLASYVGYSLKEPMGQPRVVIGVDAAEAEFFADFLESHATSATGANSGLADASPAPGMGLAAGDSVPVNGMHPQASGPMHPSVSGPMLPPVSGPQRALANGSARPVGPAPVSGPLSTSPALGTGPMTGTGPLGTGPADAPAGLGNGPAASASRNGGPGAAPAPRDVPSAPMVRLMDGTDTGARPGPRFEPAGPLAAPVGAERPLGGPAASGPATSVFPAIPADPPGPLGAPIAPLSPAAPNGHADHDGYQARAGSLSPAEYPGPGAAAGSPEPPDAIAAEMAGWASGELPGQASEHLASWAAGESGGRRLRRSRSAR